MSILLIFFVRNLQIFIAYIITKMINKAIPSQQTFYDTFFFVTNEEINYYYVFAPGKPFQLV